MLGVKYTEFYRNLSFIRLFCARVFLRDPFAIWYGEVQDEGELESLISGLHDETSHPNAELRLRRMLNESFMSGSTSVPKDSINEFSKFVVDSVVFDRNKDYLDLVQIFERRRYEHNDICDQRWFWSTDRAYEG